MPVREIVEGVLSVGAIDWDRRLFDEIIPLPDGTSYNSYLVRGSEATALIDAVDPTKTAELLGNLEAMGLDQIDYVVCHHAEQDHAGAIPDVLERYPEAVVLSSAKCRDMCVDHLHVPADRVRAVGDGETVSLGDMTLEFIMAPWVHWPETMFTHLPERKLLFTCDFLGSHIATSDLFVRDWASVGPAAKRYYAEIMMPFRQLIPKHLERIRALDVEMIAPSHGPVWDRPAMIMDAYAEWTSPVVTNEAVVAFVSMHGSTRAMAERLVEALIERGIPVKVYNLARTDIGDLAMDLVDAATVVIATPTVLTGAHPAAVYAAYLVNALRPKTRFVGLIGSYGWSTKVVEQMASMLGGLKAEMLGPVLIKGLPHEADMKAIDGLADGIARKHREIGLT